MVVTEPMLVEVAAAREVKVVRDMVGIRAIQTLVELEG
jgi:hypothetical protein